MSPENECPRFKQNAWKKELCSNCFRPKEEHPQRPKRVQVEYKPLPEIPPSQSILKANGSCEKSLNVSFSNVEFEIIGYGGEEYSTDDDYSDADDDYGRPQEYGDAGEDEEELKRLTEANTNMNGRLNVPEKNADVVPVAAVVTPAKTSTAPKAKVAPVKASSPPLVTIKPFGEQQSQQSLVYSFLKNKEMAAAAKKETPAKTTAAAVIVVPAATVDDGEKTVDADTAVANEDARTRKTETKKTLARSSLLASSNEPFLHMKRSSISAADEVAVLASPSVQTPSQDLPAKKDPAAVVVVVPAPPPPPPPPETIKTERLPRDAVPEGPPTPPKEPEAAATDAGGLSAYKTRSNVPRMGTKHFKIKLPVAPIPFQKPVDACKPAETAESLTSRELAGEPDGKADSDEPGDQQLPPVAPANRSFLHTFSKEKSPPPPPPCDTPPRTPLRKTSSSSPPECPRSIKRQAPKPPPTPPSPMVTCASNNVHHRGRHTSVCSITDDECEVGRGPDETTTANRKLLAEYCEQIEREQRQNRDVEEPPQPADDATSRESSTLPLPSRRPSYEKKKYGKAAKVGSKIKKFLRLPSKDSTTASPQPSTRPKLEIIHPLDINKSGVQIIHNMEIIHSSIHNVKGSAHHHSARPSKPPPPPRSLPPQPMASKENSPKLTDYSDVPKACDSSTSDETYEPINYSAPECDHSSPEMARLTSMQYCGSETESEIYPAIQFGDDFGVEDTIRNTQTSGHKSLEESYDAVVIANHEALTKLLDQASSGPKIPKELMVLQTNGLKWSSFYVDSTSRLQKGDYAFYNSKWYDVPVVLSISAKQIKLNNILNNHFTLTKVSQFIDCVGKEFSANNENEDSYVTLWNAHRIESIESYCKEYNAKYSDVTKEAGLVLVEVINLLMGLQASNVEKYSLQPFVITRNCFGADPSVAVIQVENNPKDEDTLCNIMLNVLKMLAPSWEMTVCLSQVLRQGKANSLSKCKALLEFWLWGPTGVTVSPDRPLSLKRWLDLERANTLHGHVCARSTNLTVQQICYMSFLVANDDKLFTEAWTVMAGKKLRPPRDPTISKC